MSDSWMTFDAVFENGLLRPLQPLPLQAHERVTVTLRKSTPAVWPPDVADIYQEIADERPPSGRSHVSDRQGLLAGERETNLNSPSTKPVRRGEVYWLDFAPATGQEMTGPHPCLIVQNDIGNQHSALTIVVAITSSLRVASLPVGVPTRLSQVDTALVCSIGL